MRRNLLGMLLLMAMVPDAEPLPRAPRPRLDPPDPEPDDPDPRYAVGVDHGHPDGSSMVVFKTSNPDAQGARIEVVHWDEPRRRTPAQRERARQRRARKKKRGW